MREMLISWASEIRKGEYVKLISRTDIFYQYALYTSVLYENVHRARYLSNVSSGIIVTIPFSVRRTSAAAR